MVGLGRMGLGDGTIAGVSGRGLGWWSQIGLWKVGLCSKLFEQPITPESHVPESKLINFRKSGEGRVTLPLSRVHRQSCTTVTITIATTHRVLRTGQR